MRNRPVINFQPSQAVGNLADPISQCVCDDAHAAALISRAQRLRHTPGWDRNDGVCAPRFSTFHELVEKLGGDFRHVACQNQVPFAVGDGESRMNAGERPASLKTIFGHRISKVNIPAAVADQCNITYHAIDLSHNVFHQRSAAKRKQGLIGSHTRTAASGKDERSALHAEMITLEECCGC